MRESYIVGGLCDGSAPHSRLSGALYMHGNWEGSNVGCLENESRDSLQFSREVVVVMFEEALEE
jgi:hypothetical protein